MGNRAQTPTSSVYQSDFVPVCGGFAAPAPSPPDMVAKA